MPRTLDELAQETRSDLAAHEQRDTAMEARLTARIDALESRLWQVVLAAAGIGSTAGAVAGVGLNYLTGGG